MIEKFSNLAVNILSAAITTTTATSCSLTDAHSFPTSGSFRIKIDDEILLVTAVAGNTFTITRSVEGTVARPRTPAEPPVPSCSPRVAWKHGLPTASSRTSTTTSR